MRYQLFGRSGLRVSELCLGTMTFGEGWVWGTDNIKSRAIFDLFADAGGNFIDTAPVYTTGLSETLVGEFVASDRDHFVISTKYTPSLGSDISKSGNSRKNMRRSVEESLRRLQTDYIDIFWLHFWDYTTPLDEIMRGLDDLVSAGKINYVAVSDTPAWQVSRANTLADLKGWSPFIGIQVEYSLLERTAERDLLPMAKELDLGITAWSPLGGGVLTGKHSLTPESEGTVRGMPISQRDRDVSNLVVTIARDIGVTPSQVALAAIRQERRFGSIIPIIGARTPEQMVDNLGCLTVDLSDAHLSALGDATRIELGFPHALLRTPMMRTLGFAGQYDSLDNHRSYAAN